MTSHTHAHSGTWQCHRRSSITLIWMPFCLALRHRFRHTHLVQFYVPSSKPAIVDGLPPKLQGGYVCNFGTADAAFQAGWMEETSQSWEACWQNWCTYVRPLGLDPYLQHTPFQTCIRCLMGFAAHTRTGFYGWTKGAKLHGFWCNHSHWPDNCHGLQQ